MWLAPFVTTTLQHVVLSVPHHAFSYRGNQGSNQGSNQPCSTELSQSISPNNHRYRSRSRLPLFMLRRARHSKRIYSRLSGARKRSARGSSGVRARVVHSRIVGHRLLMQTHLNLRSQNYHHLPMRPILSYSPPKETIGFSRPSAMTLHFRRTHHRLRYLLCPQAL